MASLNIETGELRIARRELGYGAKYPLHSRMPEVERDWYTLLEGKGLRPYKRLNFRQINYLRMKMPAVNTCIDFIKNRMITFPFRITRKEKQHNNYSEKRAAKVRKLLEGPNQHGHTYRMLMMMLLDNLLERDLGCIEKANSPIIGIDQIGVVDSIKMRPNPIDKKGNLDPTRAYLEMDTLDPEKVVNEYEADEIVWANLNPQAGSFYGFSPIEMLDRIIMMSIYADQHNIKIVHPNSEKGGGIVYLGDVTGKVRKEFEDRYELWRKNDPGRPVFFAGGDKEPSHLNLDDGERLEWEKLQTRLSEIAASSYQLNLRDIGISSITGKGAAGTAEIEDAITMKSAIIPRLLIMQDILTVGVVQPAGGDDLQLEYVTKKDEPLETRVRSGNMALGRGGLTHNEYRDLIDPSLEPYPPEIGDKPVIIAGNKVLLLEDVMKGNTVPLDEDISGKIIDAQKKFRRNTEAKQDRGADEAWT